MAKWLIMDSEGNIYTSIMDAERKTGVAHQNISSVLNGKRASAGGMTWARVKQEDGNTFEDDIEQLQEQIKEREQNQTPRQQKARAKSWEWRKHYQNTVDTARSYGLLFYRYPKELGEHPTNKQIHEYNLKANDAYFEWYERLMNDNYNNITLIEW